jgi:predicted nucleotidyltransferase
MIVRDDAARRVTDEQISEMVRLLVAEFSPHAVYLFGWHVYGALHRDSDVDVMVIVESPRESFVDLYQRGQRRLLELSLPVELHFSSLERFNRFAPVFGSLQHEVRTKGLLLYAPKR